MYTHKQHQNFLQHKDKQWHGDLSEPNKINNKKDMGHMLANQILCIYHTHTHTHTHTHKMQH